MYFFPFPDRYFTERSSDCRGTKPTKILHALGDELFFYYFFLTNLISVLYIHIMCDFRCFFPSTSDFSTGKSVSDRLFTVNFLSRSFLDFPIVVSLTTGTFAEQLDVFTQYYRENARKFDTRFITSWSFGHIELSKIRRHLLFFRQEYIHHSATGYNIIIFSGCLIFGTTVTILVELIKYTLACNIIENYCRI